VCVFQLPFMFGALMTDRLSKRVLYINCSNTKNPTWALISASAELSKPSAECPFDDGTSVTPIGEARCVFFLC
jgi:hypothetical protein